MDKFTNIPVHASKLLLSNKYSCFSDLWLCIVVLLYESEISGPLKSICKINHLSCTCKATRSATCVAGTSWATDLYITNLGTQHLTPIPYQSSVTLYHYTSVSYRILGIFLQNRGYSCYISFIALKLKSYTVIITQGTSQVKRHTQVKSFHSDTVIISTFQTVRIYTCKLNVFLLVLYFQWLLNFCHVVALWKVRLLIG